MRFTEEEKLTILAEGEKTGVKTVCAKYGVHDPVSFAIGASH
jgi:transposase-like protein